MSKKRYYPMNNGTLHSTIDYKAWIAMSASFRESYQIENKKYQDKPKVKEYRKPRNRGN